MVIECSTSINTLTTRPDYIRGLREMQLQVGENSNYVVWRLKGLSQFCGNSDNIDRYMTFQIDIKGDYLAVPNLTIQLVDCP